jgi:hypothetical protein
MLSGAVQFAQCSVGVVLLVMLQVVVEVADTPGSLCDIHGDRVSDVRGRGVADISGVRVPFEVSVRVRRGVAVAGVVGDPVGRNVAVAPNDQLRRGAVTVVGDGLMDTLRDAATRPEKAREWG